MSDKPAEQPKEEKKEKKEKKEKGEGKADKKAAKAATITEKLDPPPAYIASRIALFDDLYKKQQDEIAAKESVDINVTLPDGKVIVAKSWRTTPLEIANEGLARDAVISKVNGNLWDLPRVLEGDCTLQFLKFDDDEAKAVFWHSSAHVLGEAMELHSGCSLCYGPPIQDGFYYDAFTNGQSFSEANYPAFESLMGQAVKEKQPFQRLVMTKEDLLKMFDYNEFKKRIINEKIDTPTTTVYRCGPLIDLCRGPHVPDTSRIKAFAVTKSSSTYWEGKADAESLQRVYGISFPDKKMLKEWQTLQEEAAKRDHRKIGKDQELFFFHEWSPGSCFFLPKGAHIYNKLVEFIKKQYWSRGFTEVVSPNMYNAKLWEVSGHWEHYADDMFQLEVEKEKFALKPMNCPGHCLMFQHRVRSYRELPLRFADFGVLHRNELSGALTGLTRVRRFQQDDAHIFCMFDQIESEIAGCLDFLKYVYGTFGFTFELNLSTRPEKFLGEKETWDAAEAALANALNTFGQPWKLNPGDGAFYGPKIDIRIKDAIKRSHQCATIQLDFQLPQRFKLEYVPAEAKADEITRPVILHRAVLGSVERMIAILCENYGGKWPFWLSPRQATIVPVHPKFTDYAIKVRDFLRSRGFVSELDIDDGSTLNKKIRNAQLAQYNFILVVGEQEEKKETVNVRSRDNAVHGERTLEEVAAHFTKLATEYLADENFPAKEGQAAPVAADAEAEAGDAAAAPAAAAAESGESGTKTAVV